MQPEEHVQHISNMLEVDTDIGEPDTGILEPDTGMLERTLLMDEPDTGTINRAFIVDEPNTGMLERDTGVIARSDLADAQMDIVEEIEAIHNGYRHEVQQYQIYLAEMMEERNQLQAAYQGLEHRYAELYDNFLASVEEEAHRMVTEATRTITLSPTTDAAPPLLRDAVQSLEVHARQLEDEHTAHTLYLMREAQRKAAQLEEQLRIEHLHIAEERQNLINLQNSVREQAQLRYRSINARLQARWKLQLVVVSGVLLTALLVGQALLLALLHVHMSETLVFSLTAPILLCPLIAYAFTHMRKITLHLYHDAPHKIKVKTVHHKA